jgi:arylesterase/paraoxonase
MDVVVSLANPLEVFVFLVNHRPPIDHAKASLTGADSVIEVFRSNVASDVLHHIHTFESEVIDTPNDLIGSFDGKSLYFTNDHGSKTGKVVCFPFSDFHPPNEEGPHTGKTYLGFAHTSVGYCHVDEGCKYAARTLRGSNGIVKVNQLR